jgi:sec-independent protein translocase protein TatB
MFDIAFSELLVLALVGLLVLGPKRWPAAAAKVGNWAGSARRSATRFYSKLEWELKRDEIARRPKPNLRLVRPGGRGNA